jgi:hypothetical protein
LLILGIIELTDDDDPDSRKLFAGIAFQRGLAASGRPFCARLPPDRGGAGSPM